MQHLVYLAVKEIIRHVASRRKVIFVFGLFDSKNILPGSSNICCMAVVSTAVAEIFWSDVRSPALVFPETAHPHSNRNSTEAVMEAIFFR